MKVSFNNSVDTASIEILKYEVDVFFTGDPVNVNLNVSDLYGNESAIDNIIDVFSDTDCVISLEASPKYFSEFSIDCISFTKDFEHNILLVRGDNFKWA